MEPNDEGQNASSTAGEDTLAQIQLFGQLDNEERASLVEMMHEEKFAANQTVFWLGDTGSDFYLVTQGRVAIIIPNEEGEHVTLTTLGPGGFFGEISFLDGGRRTATIRAVEDSTCLVLRRASFHDFLRKRPDVAIEILSVMGQRQRSSTELLRTMKNPNVVFESNLKTWQRISDVIATTAASQWFTLVHFIWFAGWIGMNAIGMIFENAPRIFTWDPYPFGLLTMVVSLEAIFLSIFVMVSQNRQSEKDRLRTDLDYQVNVKAQTEIVQIARRLEQIESQLAVSQAAQARDAEQ